jgi:hypothetical protein
LSALAEVLAEFARRGIRLRVVGTTAKVVKLSPKAALDKNLLARARAVKDGIIGMLSRRPATCSKECYEVEPGCWIHRPWAGCTTTRGPAVEAYRDVVELVCWHCLGRKRCNCANCQEPDDTCAVCSGAGLVRGTVQ